MAEEQVGVVGQGRPLGEGIPSPSHGEFLLQLLQKRHDSSNNQSSSSSSSQDPQHPFGYGQLDDPAVAALGPSLPLPHHSFHLRPQIHHSGAGQNWSLESPWAVSFPGQRQGAGPPLQDGLLRVPLPHSSSLRGDFGPVKMEKEGTFGWDSAGLRMEGGLPLQFGSIGCELQLQGNAGVRVQEVNSERRKEPLLQSLVHGISNVNIHGHVGRDDGARGMSGANSGSQHQRRGNYSGSNAAADGSAKECSRPPGFSRRPGNNGKEHGRRVVVNEKRDGDNGEASDDPNFHKQLHARDQIVSGSTGLSYRGVQQGGVLRHRVDRMDHSDHYCQQNGDSFSPTLPLSVQLDHPGPPVGSNVQSVQGSNIDQSLNNLPGSFPGERPRGQRSSNGVVNGAAFSEPNHRREGHRGNDKLVEGLNGMVVPRDGVLTNNAGDDPGGSGGKDLIREFSGRDFKTDSWQGPRPHYHRMKNYKMEFEYRTDLYKHTSHFLAIYESLIPAEEEKAKQRQLLASMEKLVNKEWPDARLLLYGSCANSFGVCKSDIDVCLSIKENCLSKSDILLRLADILQSDNLQNVQALTHARVPIVKLMDPGTGISCDICINNVLAVVNTKLLHDYAQIDVRLRQLAFIVKHWAKSRQVNETYRGTLSSYAYVLMCIHFLQQRRPPILPCLQEMVPTYVETIEDIKCAFYDKVENLKYYGAANKETVSQLICAFFDYWAYHHDYANSVISVRTGSIISKRVKEWTRRIGKDRHLICIEDPFDISHDLGRIVDRHSINVLRDEFRRAADILRYDPNPSVTLFEPYLREQPEKPP
ncbi:UTP:RNA uridylyltransferase 1 [Amborella trichopoda]|uniref:RNA uridylyltransferase n=1 Tax=Amborella trichopoda TaxID=13333 RepID=W1NM10_AMBTC|nr:UTP:RNA uridylyltransferase 1 [Amborella trichopoda]ERM96556.1 hypothetical protein AMTR_s00001p00269200 [Amborella trichopoda]|eukprot:XP_006829140.1 UTP:RNA uridylyltransferase 1 [Amborella trichopoda]